MAAKRETDFRMVIPSTLDEIESVEKLAEKAALKMNFNEDEKDSLAIAVTEAVNNAIIHGNKEDESKKVIIEFTFDEDILTVTIEDEGKGFNPENLRDPLAPENLLKENGRGIFILSSLMDEVDYDFASLGTKLVMTKKKRNS